jgi:hypothetical protein
MNCLINNIIKILQILIDFGYKIISINLVKKMIEKSEVIQF